MALKKKASKPYAGFSTLENTGLDMQRQGQTIPNGVHIPASNISGNQEIIHIISIGRLVKQRVQHAIHAGRPRKEPA